MQKNILLKILIWFLGIFGVLFLLFLILPLILSPILNANSDKITEEIKKQTGFKVVLNEIGFVTTPKLTAGAKLRGLKIYEPNGFELLAADNMQLKMSLLPVFLKKIRVDLISVDNVEVSLGVKKDGKFSIEEAIASMPVTNNDKKEEAETSLNSDEILPFGLKLSNHMPDIRVKNHKISFVDLSTGKKYVLSGNDTNITDFIINKKIKIQGEGKLVLDGYQAFDYNVRLLNYLMPEDDINKMIAEAQKQETAPNKDDFSFNILDTFKVIKNYGIKGSLVSDLKADGTVNSPELNGKAVLSGLSVLINGKKLPESKVDLKFNKDEYTVNSSIYTAQNETTTLTGLIKTGKKPKIDLTCKSNATLKNIFEIANYLMMSFGINDFKTLSAYGNLDVNFNIKSDFKNLTSNGHLKLLNGMVNYGLYGVKLENLGADIALDNNSVVINKLGFSTFSIPLNITGKIKPDATADIKIQTSSLPVKGLLISLGQGAILKENPVNSGTVTVLATVKDKLTAPKIEGKVAINNLNLKNIPSNTSLSVNPININLQTTKTGFDGTIEASSIKALNPALTVSSLSAKAKINEKDINLLDTKVFAGKNEMTVSGLISDYMKEKIGLDFQTKGKLNSNLSGHINPSKMTLDLKYSIPNNSEVIIPGFDKSKVTLNGSTAITGSMTNPILKGAFNMSSVEIPEIPVSIKNMSTNLNGPILNGNANLESFVTGTIAAKNIKTDYKLQGDDFYLSNLQGTAFDGSFDGNIVYNLTNEKCAVKFNGKNMNALKAIEGAAGIKNALTGTLGFNADVNFKGVEYNDMMKTLKGSADFEIKNGVLANLGGLKTLLNAQNILNNVVLKQATQNATKLSVVQAASEFDYIKGSLTFSDAYATLKSIKLSGPSMAYYITGKYQLLNGSTGAVILGRLSQSTVGALGNIGELATSKISSAIPALGALTSSIAKSMNESPKDVDVSQIPDLRSKNTSYKDFKVVFSGGIESSSSVKSFKWLNAVDTSALEETTTNTQTQNAINQINRAKSVVNDIKTKAQENNQTVKEQIKQDIKTQAKEQTKELFKNLLTTPSNGSN